MSFSYIRYDIIDIRGRRLDDLISMGMTHSGTDLSETHSEKCATRSLARSLRSARRSARTLRHAPLR